MKDFRKLTALFACILIAFFAFAQTNAPVDEDPLAEEPDLKKVETIVEKGKLYTLTIEYMPNLDEARFIYKCPAPLFDQGDGMNVIRERVRDFQVEHNYYGYAYMKKDVTKYDNETNYAIYMSFIKFQK